MEPTVLCTLYNSLYLDKGLVLFDSLKANANSFILYVLCMDNKCFEVISELKQNCLIPIKLADFEYGDNDLLNAKSNRTMGEYCWTCSSSLIRYILNTFKHNYCTYIDADMYFYSDPQILVDEMIRNNKSAMVVPHRFSKTKIAQEKIVGKYCVEFNTFRNDEDGRTILEYWRNLCLESCNNIGDGIHWGDQKYLEVLVGTFDGVHVCTNNGAGIAPWNIERYEQKDNNVIFKDCDTPINVVFYHYQSISYINNNIISTGVQLNNSEIDYDLIKKMYSPYLCAIKEKKKYLLEHFGIDFTIKRHPQAFRNPVFRIVLNSKIWNFFRDFRRLHWPNSYLLYLPDDGI